MEAPRGFKLAGVYCGIKQSNEREDVALFVADGPAVAAGVYTQNVIAAPSVVRNRELTPSSAMRAVLVTSGNANACTGERGMRDAQRSAEWVAEHCGIEPDQVLVLSTGVIGHYLPMEKIAAGIERAAAALGRDQDAVMAAARGMLTTNKDVKLASRRVAAGDTQLTISGWAKGAAMIGPRMATMLAVILTDAAVDPADAQRVLAAAVDDSFNCCSVEGHMSTNDTVLLLASGTQGETPLAGELLEHWAAAVREVCIDLARMMPDDGEGASHLIQIRVAGCRERSDAFRIAKTVADSALVKTAIAGGDPNWGRIVSATGYAGVDFDPRRTGLVLNGFPLFKDGMPVDYDESEVSESIRANRLTTIDLSFGEGEAEVSFWTSDLTEEYVRFNSDYRT